MRKNVSTTIAIPERFAHIMLQYQIRLFLD